MTSHHSAQAATGNNQKKAWITPTVEELDVMAHTQNDIVPGFNDGIIPDLRIFISPQELWRPTLNQPIQPQGRRASVDSGPESSVADRHAAFNVAHLLSLKRGML